MVNRYYTVINVGFDKGAVSNPMVVKLNKTDVGKIFRVLNILKTELAVEFIDTEMGNVIFDIFIDYHTRIKIVNNQLYVSRQGVLELYVDEKNLVRDIILDKALGMNYDDMQDILRSIYPYKRLKRMKAKPLFTPGITRNIMSLSAGLQKHKRKSKEKILPQRSQRTQREEINCYLM